MFALHNNSVFIILNGVAVPSQSLFQIFWTFQSVVKEWHNVFCDPVVVKGHVAAWYLVESKLACLIQGLQT